MTTVESQANRPTSGHGVASYAALISIQTAAALYLFNLVFPLFLQMLGDLGEPIGLSIVIEIKVFIGGLALHCSYWARYWWVPVPSKFRNVVIGHLVQFAGRTSFVFASALFGTIFFRHVPEILDFPTILETGLRLFLVGWMLFALFCYSLDLDRLGRSIEGPLPGGGG